MELEILRLVYDYSVKGKLVDQQFLDKLVEIIVTKRSLNDYVKDAKISQLPSKISENACASYSLIDKKIQLYIPAINNVLEHESNFDVLFEEHEKILFRNFIITQSILHELEHAYQYKKAKDKNNQSIEKKIISACLIVNLTLSDPNIQSRKIFDMMNIDEYLNLLIHLKNNRELNKKYYRINPVERLAQVYSYITVVNSLKPIKDVIPSLYEFENACLYEQMIRMYPESWQNGVCPTQVFFYSMGQQKSWDKLGIIGETNSEIIENACSKLDVFDRLTLGLPVRESEYDGMHDLLLSTNKYRI